jgi:predicted NBD/HSP70 family sugar kinase
MVDILEPDVMIIGGGVASILRPLFEEIRERIPACSVNSRCHEIPLLPAFYGIDSGIAGGAALV